MRQLLPPAEADVTDADLAALYAYPDGPRWLRANMVQSADGGGSLEGRSGGLSSPGDRHVFALLRTLADVIVVGAATARAERYGPVRPRELWRHLRDGRSAIPPIAVITARGELDPASPLLMSAPADARTIVITTEQAPAGQRARLAANADVIVAGEKSVDLTVAIGELTERGHRTFLAEGGPHLLAQIIAAGLLDELCLTISPLLAGPGPGRIVAGDRDDGTPLPLTLAHAVEDNGFLLCRYTVGTT